MNQITLRPYQQKGIDLLYESLRSGNKNVIWWLATGGGKTISFIYLAQQCSSMGLNVVIVMRRRVLIGQTSSQLDKFNIEHGVFMAGHPRYKLSRKVQVCSVDTIGAREIYPHEGNPNTIVIVDESQDCNPKGKKYANLFEKYSSCPIIGFTATPFADNSLFNDIICPIDNLGLLEQGYLMPVKSYVPNLIDVSSVSIKRNGKFNEEELFEACSSNEVVGNIVDDWLKYGRNRRTVLFAVNIEHSKMLCDAFNERGIPALHCDGGSKNSERDRALRKLKDDEIKILCNVNVFSTGLDLVEIECIIFARPTRSIIYYLQAIGRGLRPAPHIDKKDCIIIDSAGNFLRFGSPYKQRDAHIGKPKKISKDEIEDITIRACKQCFYIFEAKEKVCPECGFVNPPVIRKIKTREGDLVELDLSDEELAAIRKKNFKSDYFKLDWVAKTRVFKKVHDSEWKTNKVKEWVCQKLVEKYGLEFCQEHEELLPK